MVARSVIVTSLSLCQQKRVWRPICDDEMVPSHAWMLRHHRVNTSYQSQPSLTLISHGIQIWLSIAASPLQTLTSRRQMGAPAPLLSLLIRQCWRNDHKPVTADRSHSNSPPSKPKHMATHSLVKISNVLKRDCGCVMLCNVFMTPPPVCVTTAICY